MHSFVYIYTQLWPEIPKFSENFKSSLKLRQNAYRNSSNCQKLSEFGPFCPLHRLDFFANYAARNFTIDFYATDKGIHRFPINNHLDRFLQH